MWPKFEYVTHSLRWIKVFLITLLNVKRVSPRFALLCFIDKTINVYDKTPFKFFPLPSCSLYQAFISCLWFFLSVSDYVSSLSLYFSTISTLPVYLSIFEFFKLGQPGLFICLFSFFSNTNLTVKNCRLQWESNANCHSRRRACWPLDKHHFFDLSCFTLFDLSSSVWHYYHLPNAVNRTRSAQMIGMSM